MREKIRPRWPLSQASSPTCTESKECSSAEVVRGPGRLLGTRVEECAVRGLCMSPSMLQAAALANPEVHAQNILYGWASEFSTDRQRESYDASLRGEIR